MNKPKVSIIIPIYNVEKYLNRCLESVVNQTLKDIEIICINDGSTDKSLNILENFTQKDPRIIVINKENGGISSARNKGLEIVQGEYIGFVDSDDWIDSNFFERLYNCAKKYNSDISVTNVLRERKKTKSIRVKYNKEKLYTDKNDIFNICDCPNICYVWNKIYNTKFFKSTNLCFQEGMYFEDIMFTTKILHSSKSLVTVPDTLYHYMINDRTSIVKSATNPKKDSDRYYNQKNSLLFCIENNIKIKEKEFIINNKYYEFFKIIILKIKDDIKNKKHIYYLFGFIPIYKKSFD